MIYAYKQAERMHESVFSANPPKKEENGTDGSRDSGMTKTGKLIAALLALILCMVLCGCAPKAAATEFFAMDTVMRLTAYGKNAEEALARCEEEIAKLDTKLSAQSAESEIAKLNAGGSCEEPDTLEVLTDALEIARRTDGAYDPTVYPLMTLWGFGTENAHVPQQKDIDEVLSHVGYEKLPDVTNAYSLPEKMAVDLGGIGKGFAAKKARQSLTSSGITSAVLSLGGNVTLVGAKPDGSDWTVGLQDPSLESLFGFISGKNVSVVTSGGYQRYFEENGERYWHILDAKTGWPAKTGLASVTIVSENDVLADGLSTALFVMGLEKAEDFWRENGDFEAVFLLESGEIFVTEGLKDSFRADRGFEVIAR